MKSTGIVRKTDGLGRLSLPVEIRRAYNLSVGSEIDISTLGDTIILKKYETMCIFCGSSDNLKMFKEKSVCDKCVGEI